MKKLSMLGFISSRFFHTCRLQFNVAKSSGLSKLRKATGYSVSNCKKALELFPDDVAKAEEWLHAQAKQQGWSKWAKIQTRSASQGLIGVFSRDKIGVMVEVNCETDFVSRNLEFQQLVENILLGCVNHISGSSVTDDVTKTLLDETQLNGIQHNSTTLGELMNTAVCKFNEKTVLKRAVCLQTRENISLKSLSHPNTICPNLPGATIGKYGTLLAYKYNNLENANDKDVSLDICQHIIGMNPSSLGQLTEQDILSFSKQMKTEEAVEIKEPKEAGVEMTDSATVDQIDHETEEYHTVNDDLKDSNETQLLFQPFLLDPNVTVGEIVVESSLDIIAFERFECGENLDVGLEAKEAMSAKI